MKAIAKPNHFRVLAAVAAVALAASLLVFLGLASEPAGAITSAQENGKLAFVSDRDGDEDIYIANPDGTDVEQLTTTSGAESTPAWSPDGKRIAFARNEDATDALDSGNWDIFVRNEDGTETQITTDSGAEYRPSWSPDGTKIVYGSSSVGYVNDGNIDLYVINSDGSGTPQQLTSGPSYEMHPAWSPDGTKIAYTDGSNGLGEIYVMNADGSGAMNLSNHSTPDDQPAWSPDSKQIAWSSYAFSQPAVEIRNADGSGSSRVLTEPGIDGWPAWSPDGTQIAFHSFSSDDAEVYLANADGSSSQPTNITNSASSSERFVAWQKKPMPSDTTQPTTTATPSVEPNAAGWNKEDVTVTLSATDNEGGSGIKEITYSINGGQPTTEQGDSVEIPVTAEGVNTIAFYATDNAGNTEDEQTTTVKIDKTPPAVSSTSPANNATGVSATTKISATFSESGAGIDPATLTAGTFKVAQVKPSGNAPVSGTVSYDEASKTVTFTPDSNLAKGAYQATITTGVEDKADNALANAYTWQFATAGPSK